ncbi:phosphodiester glycosidase family protein [Streptacidiphilus neutrinimicus]|uniref:phosphodiester glycosidase family protein n=1 Tax=Streptacidiphilus neutrinimicus TaxID=105420 RepID=UPI0005A804E4|nr:phosphodiester glycosidase family protein [Streptacidiphilus neutrinimicus]
MAGPITHRRWIARRVLRGVLAVVLVLALWTGYSVYGALAAPGTDSTAARLAEWGRDHGLNWAINWLEVQTYTPPKAGGSVPPDALARMRAAQQQQELARKSAITLHPPVRTLVDPPLPGEGDFSPLVEEHGQPVVQSATMRPDTQYTSFPVGVVWMKQSALSFALHPGFQEPGGSWSVPASVPAGQRHGLVATYNGGFKVSNGDSHGGFYLDGRTVGTLRDGAASEVFYKNGSLRIGVWGQDVGMTPDVIGVRQCLVPLVAHGQVTSDVYNGGTATWGFTDQGMPFVPRSGVGVDKNGDIIYVGGRVLSVQTLAVLLQRAGAVTAMMLDINLSWPSFISYDGSRDAADPTPHNLVNFVRPADRYYQPSSRDFVAVYARPHQ